MRMSLFRRDNDKGAACISQLVKHVSSLHVSMSACQHVSMSAAGKHVKVLVSR
jgi:hypothetical protein